MDMGNFGRASLNEVNTLYRNRNTEFLKTLKLARELTKEMGGQDVRMEFSRSAWFAQTYKRGSLEDSKGKESIREFVCRLLEGGSRVFKVRENKYVPAAEID